MNFVEVCLRANAASFASAAVLDSAVEGVDEPQTLEPHEPVGATVFFVGEYRWRSVERLPARKWIGDEEGNVGDGPVGVLVGYFDRWNRNPGIHRGGHLKSFFHSLGNGINRIWAMVSQTFSILSSH